MSAPAWHALTHAELYQRLSTGSEGLAESQVATVRAHLGSNQLPPPHHRSAGLVFLDQFRSALIYILLIATVISFWLGEWQDGFVIFVVVLLNAVIGWRQELQSTEAVMKLLRLAPQIVHVIRGGTEREIGGDELVVGDVVVVGTGDVVPADGRWIEALNVRVNEAALTGEAVPVSKQTEPLPVTADLGERRNMAWRGTLIVAGRGQFIVTAVGLQTRFGAIVANVQSRPPEATPFQRKLSSFSRRLAVATLIFGLAIFGLGLIRQLPPQEMFLLSVSMVVSIIPEGLPVVITMAMAWGMWAMAKRQALVRKLAAVETLGAVTVVATDKTGTLTFGEMMVEKLWVDQQSFHLTGQGYAPEGNIILNGQTILGREQDGLSAALRLGAMNNDGRFSARADGTRQAIGDPTELALIVAAGKAGWSKHDLDMAHPRVGEFPFDFKKKYMVTWHRQSPTEILVTIKGAPREVLEHCASHWTKDGVRPINDADRARVMEVYERWAGEALRGLAVAQLVVPAAGPFAPEKSFGQFMFVGLFGIADSLRPEANEAIARMHHAGIRVIMMTGDYQKTGIAIGQRLGLVTSPRPEQLLDGAEVDALTDTALRQRLHHVRIGTRLTPDHKFRIAKLLKADGAVVAMTGDGINDVPAIVEADVGIAVGQGASDAAKEAADILLIDGNFESITAAIAEGRRIFRNIRRVMFYLLASNFGELVLVVAGLLVGLPLPLLPKQIIWLNAVTDPFMGIALAREPQSPSVLQEKPHDPLGPIVERAMWERILVTAGTIGFVSLVVFAWALGTDRTEREVYALTLTTVALGQWLTSLNARSASRSIFGGHRANPAMLTALVTVIGMQMAILYIPFLADIFEVAPLSLTDWGIAIAAASPVVVIDEIRKWWVRRHYQPQTHHAL